MSDVAPIGHNQPPAPTPFEAMEAHILDLFETAQGFLDGEPIANQGTADMVGKLIDDARTARKDADELRKAEAKPFDDGKKAVQAKWTPLTDETKGKCALIISTAKQALAPWLKKLDDEQRAIAEQARKDADAARAVALEAEQAARATDDLAAAEMVEQARKDAAIAEKAANRADKAKPLATGGARSIGLRSYWIAEITDRRETLKHYMQAQPDALTAWLLDQAQKDVNAGKRSIPGVTVTEERRAA